MNSNRTHNNSIINDLNKDYERLSNAEQKRIYLSQIYGWYAIKRGTLDYEQYMQDLRADTNDQDL